ncbi:hypothetical protein KUL113_58060 [Tenacibaculum sp. KUL113]|nr:hypothetical protein BACT7_23870 [Tenacibaculum mesophilum]GFD76386.1 hypothetical protein KUL113_58060 [Tenacibaculum sp. KUL113]
MKKIFVLLIIVYQFSCGRNKYEKKIIGEWYDYNESMKLSFSEDSVTIYDYQILKTIWKANNKEIQIPYKLFGSDSVINPVLNYNLKSNDTLIITNTKDSLTNYTFLRAKNYLDFLAKKNNLSFSLDKNEQAFMQRKDDFYGIKIFLGYHKNKIIAKSEFSNNLNNLDYDLKIKLRDINKDYEDNYKGFYDYEKWKNKMLHYYVFCDENIPIDTLNTYLEKLRKSKINKIYRVYNTLEEEFMPFQNLKQIQL